MNPVQWKEREAREGLEGRRAMLGQLETSAFKLPAGIRREHLPRGVIAFFEEPMVVTAPETAQAGVPFQVSVRTYGSGCHSRGETVVEVAGVHVDVRPYDILSGRHTCNSILRMFDHAASNSVALEDAFNIQPNEPRSSWTIDGDCEDGTSCRG